MRILPVATLLALTLVHPVRAQDAPVFDEVMEYARDEAWSSRPLGQIMQAVGELFLGAPYEGGLLDRGMEERLYTDLDRFDCVLFVESVLALSRGIAQERYDFASYARRIEEQRYRGGAMDGYCSRLHYFTDWIRDNERRGLVENMTRALGGERANKVLDFMGTHREAYPRLVSDSLYAGILAMEKDLEAFDVIVLRQEDIRAAYPSLRAGDILAFATSVDGLDVAHTGLVHEGPDGARGVLHASLDRGVVISPDLHDYVNGIRSHVGIVVARPVDSARGGGMDRP